MICPYCQADLDPSSLSCPRCGATYPGARAGAQFGLRLRMIVIAFVLLVITSLILVDCVLRALPRGEPAPDSRSGGAQRALQMMLHNQQGNQNPAPPPPHR